ncbi:aspartate/glutamate racemase family protein [Escherichia coli]|uniref:aspartate/glutamate racemase family protein n=1 Tax=Escherichia coli TaxID=562 RepID=UPI0023E8B532|nr:amino acid racemase [Escherichia coli]MDF3916232.1 amino acid racemase [Escherichia coli]
MKGLIGVLGGMGPAATVDLFNKFITFTAAQRDQEHIPLLISSIPNIPDRTDALMHNGLSPLPIMRDYMHKLEDAGAECIIIPCNTAHYWFKELKDSCHIDILSIVETTINEVRDCGKTRIGLLATDATLYMGLYQKGIESLGFTCVSPDSDGQKRVMESIYSLKAGNILHAQQLMNEQAETLFSLGAEILVLGCTEIPVILSEAIKEHPSRYIDSTASLVRAGIKWYESRVGKQRLLTQ